MEHLYVAAATTTAAPMTAAAVDDDSPVAVRVGREWEKLHHLSYSRNNCLLFPELIFGRAFSLFFLDSRTRTCTSPHSTSPHLSMFYFIVVSLERTRSLHRLNVRSNLNFLQRGITHAYFQQQANYHPILLLLTAPPPCRLKANIGQEWPQNTDHQPFFSSNSILLYSREFPLTSFYDDEDDDGVARIPLEISNCNCKCANKSLWPSLPPYPTTNGDLFLFSPTNNTNTTNK